MKLAMICPSNTLFMPYVENYKTILDENQIEYVMINWDRFQIEKDSGFTYRDNHIGHQRGFFDYYHYKNFVLEKLKEYQFEKVIVFGIQLSFFLNKYLKKHYKGKYLIDIRDHHKIIDLFKLKKLIKQSAMTVISSPGFKKFLPEEKEYVINHNTQIDSFLEIVNQVVNLKNKEKIRISCIGALRDFDVNRFLIHSLKENNKLELYYHGEGNINKLIEDYLQRENIKNVYLTGRYFKEEEKELYMNSDLINVFIGTEGINNKTLLPNRLYNSVKYKKPLIALDGSFLAELIKEYRLGLVVSSLEHLEENVMEFITNFNQKDYDKGVKSFIEKVISENLIYRQRLLGFCKND